MDDLSHTERAAELLQELGLKEYEAKCYVALTRLPEGTAKEVSEVSDVPRTRVYDAARVLESKGLVEVHHANPQEFRAVDVDVAVRTLRREYESRTERLGETLRSVEAAEAATGEDADHEVWSLSGATAIASRTDALLAEADAEIVFVVGDGAVLDDGLFERLRGASDRGVDVVVGTLDEGLRDRLADEVPGAAVFVSGLSWLRANDAETSITRLLLVDGRTILVSSSDGREDGAERAILGNGFRNGFVVIARRLMATPRSPTADD